MKRLWPRLGLGLGVILIAFLTVFYALPAPGYVPVLVYHFIGEDVPGNKLIVTEEDFEKQMAFLKRFGYQVISLDELYRVKRGQRPPNPRMVAITFDDGDQSFYHRAYPVLKKYDFPVAVFVVVRHLDKGDMGSMKWEQVRELLAKGVTIGSHTLSHPVLTEINPAKQHWEIRWSKTRLYHRLKHRVDYISYPTGMFDEEVKETVQRMGYKMGFGTFRKKLRGEKEDLFSMQRLMIRKSHRNLAYFWLTLSGIYQTYHRARSKSNFDTPLPA